MRRAAIGCAMLLVVLATIPGRTVAAQSRPTTEKSAAKSPEKSTAKPAPAARDLKVRTKFTSGAQVSENVTYIKGARQRVEFPGAVTIAQDDLGRVLLLNPASKTYLVQTRGDAPESASAKTDSPAPDTPQTPGLVTYTTTLTDTGERKQMFGREARRVITVITRDASASACDKTPMTVEVDGWYVDVARSAQSSAGSASSRSPAPALTAGACVDRVETRTTGEAKLGFPIATTTTTRTGQGDKQETSTSSMEVTALEETTLDAALFDVPAGYTELRSNAEAAEGFKAAGGLSEALLGSTADGTSAAAPKSAGTIRVGVLEPVDKSTHNLPTRELRQELAANFHKAPFEALTLAGTSVAEAHAEAGRMECDYVLYSEISDIRTSKPGRVGGMLKKVTRDGPARDVHEVKLDYKLYRVGAAPTDATFVDSAKASSGGGFDIHAALRVAMLAGSLYLRFTGLGLLNPMLFSNAGGGLGPLASAGLFDPRVSAMSSMTRLLTSPGVDALRDNGAVPVPGAAANRVDAEAEIRHTVDAALANAAKGTMEQLKKNTRK